MTKQKSNIYIPLTHAKDKDNLNASILLKKNTKYFLHYDYCLNKVLQINTGNKNRDILWLANKIANGYYKNEKHMDYHSPDDLTLVYVNVDHKTKIITFDTDS